MIARMWRGWTTHENADDYEAFVSSEPFPDPEEKPAFEGFRVLRREHEDEVEFVTIAYFSDWEAVEAFAGEEYRSAHVPARARDLLSRFEDEATHYEVRA
ncbi:hypothetical protein [Halobacterium zhouii]|uniref:hypothetical protein n=1 Tax=Halobacterium zhouii TaxID=2902624 RepID=UPI001E39C08C|nr:hypothetical protein [Halobacterium zhouii]